MVAVVLTTFGASKISDLTSTNVAPGASLLEVSATHPSGYVTRSLTVDNLHSNAVMRGLTAFDWIGANPGQGRIDAGTIIAVAAAGQMHSFTSTNADNVIDIQNLSPGYHNVIQFRTDGAVTFAVGTGNTNTSYRRVAFINVNPRAGGAEPFPQERFAIGIEGSGFRTGAGYDAYPLFGFDTNGFITQWLMPSTGGLNTEKGAGTDFFTNVSYRTYQQSTNGNHYYYKPVALGSNGANWLQLDAPVIGALRIMTVNDTNVGLINLGTNDAAHPALQSAVSAGGLPLLNIVAGDQSGFAKVSALSLLTSGGVTGSVFSAGVGGASFETFSGKAAVWLPGHSALAGLYVNDLTLNAMDITASGGGTVLTFGTGGTAATVSSNSTIKGTTTFGNGTQTWRSGTGSPESSVTAPVGSMYTRTDGAAVGTFLYVKTNGTGSTGWWGVQ